MNTWTLAPSPGHRYDGCEACKAYQRSRNRLNRLRRLSEGNLNHGTRSAYDAGCGCDACRRARSDSYYRLEKGRGSEEMAEANERRGKLNPG